MKKKQDSSKILLKKEQRVIVLYDGGIKNSASIWRRIRNSTKTIIQLRKFIKSEWDSLSQSTFITQQIHEKRGLNRLLRNKQTKQIVDRILIAKNISAMGVIIEFLVELGKTYHYCKDRIGYIQEQLINIFKKSVHKIKLFLEKEMQNQSEQIYFSMLVSNDSA